MAIVPRDHRRGFQFRRAEQRIDPQGFRELRNADLYAPGVISKRAGWSRTGNTDLDAAALPGDLHGVGYHGDGLHRIQNHDLYAYAAPADAWCRQGAWPLVVTTGITRIARPTSIRTGGTAESGGYRATIWQEFDGALKFEIWLDISTLAGDSVLRAPLITTEVAVLLQPRAVACGNWIALTYYNNTSAEIVVHRWLPSTPRSVSASMSYASNIGYDFVGVPDREQLWIARLLGAGPAIVQLTEVRPDLTIDRDRAPAGFPDAIAVTIDRDTASTDFLIATVAPGNGGQYVWFDDGLNPQQAGALLAGERVSATITTSSSGAVFVERTATLGVEPFLVSPTAPATSPTNAVHRGYGLGLAGHAVSRGAEAYVLAVLPDGLTNDTSFATSDSSYFVLRARDLAIVTRAYPLGQATTYGGRFTIQERNLAGSVVRDSGFTWPCSVRTAFVEPDAPQRAPGGYEQLGAEVLAEIDHDFGRARGKTTEHAGIATWALGGFLRGYDGRRTFEVDFHAPPRIDAIDTALGTLQPSELAPGDYVWAVTYAWRDEHGRRYRSLVATFAGTVGALSPAGIVDLTIRTVRQTERDDIGIEVWRTGVAGSVNATTFYLVSNPADLTPNDLQAPSVVFRDNQNDSLIVDNEQLQIEPAGAALAHDIVQVTGWASSAGDRLWARGAQNIARCYASQLADDANGLAMSSLLRVDLDTVAEARGLQVQDGSFFVTAADSVHVFGGRGLDNGGRGQTWTRPIAIPSSEGASLLGGIVRTEQGIIFATDDGPSLLSRDQTQSSVTGDVRELYHDTGQAITDLAFRGDSSELWLLDAGDQAAKRERASLTLYMSTLSWSRHDGLQGVATAISARGAQAIARTDGVVLLRGSIADTRTAGVETPLVVSPGWQRPSASMLAPFTPTTIGLVLLFHDPHLLRLELYLDDDPDTVRGTVEIDPERDGLRTPPTWATSPPALWGDPEPWAWSDGWPGGAYYVKIQLKAPVVRSATFRLSDYGTPSRGWSLVQHIWAWEQRSSTDGIDEGDPRGRRRYSLTVT